MGYFLVVYNPVQLSLRKEYGFSGFSASERNFFEGLITAVLPLGACVGSLASPYVFKAFGRKNSCFLLDFLCILGCGLAEIEQVALLVIGRFFCGVTVGMNSILVGLFLRELCPVELSDFLGSLGNFSLNLGIFVCFLLGLSEKSQEQLQEGERDFAWRLLFAFPAVCCGLRSCALRVFFNYESPLYLLLRNREDEALHVVKALYKEEFVQEIYEKTGLRADALRKRKNCSFVQGELLNKRYFLRILLAVSQVFANQFSGINAISFYSKRLFLSIGFSESVANYVNLGIGGVSILAGVFLVLLIKKLGLRLTYLLSLGLVALCLGLIALFVRVELEIPAILCTILYNFNYNLGCGPIIFIIIPQILPERLIGLVFICNWVFAFVVGLCFPKMMDSEMGVDGSFLFFACCVVVTFAVNLAFLRETGGKTNAEISNVYVKLKDYEGLEVDEVKEEEGKDAETK